MAMPWLQIVDAALNVADIALSRRGGRDDRERDEGRAVAAAEKRGGGGPLEARLAGVVVAALQEAFDRDSRRLDLEREQAEIDRDRAERALRMELRRQAGDREVGRMRLVAALAVGSWLGTLFFSARLIGGPVGARVSLGIGWALLLLALALAFSAQSRVARALMRLDALDGSPAESLTAGAAGAAAPWLVVAGLAVVGAAVLM
jgi:hypothetical protein